VPVGGLAPTHRRSERTKVEEVFRLGGLLLQLRFVRYVLFELLLLFNDGNAEAEFVLALAALFVFAAGALLGLGSRRTGQR